MRQILAILLMLCLVLPAPGFVLLPADGCPGSVVCAEAVCPCCAAGHCECSTQKDQDPAPAPPPVIKAGQGIIAAALPPGEIPPGPVAGSTERTEAAAWPETAPAGARRMVPLYVRHCAYLK